MLRNPGDGIGAGERIGDMSIAPAIIVAIIVMFLIFFF